MKQEWSKKFPKKVGKYWFYGYRYGKVSCGHPCEPELMLLEVFKCANGVIYKCDGQFMYKQEIEEAHFLPVDLPQLPTINTELTAEQEGKLSKIYVDKP